jgi:uncharacterized protein YdaU (DUF1376 family)
VKFYKRFPGDINIKTGHLTPAQFGCYDRLLDHYYATEAPIPAGGAYSICRAVTASDRAACDAVLAQFFVRTDAGWEQQRAEEVIAEALPRIEAAKKNGAKGGRPPGSKKKPTGLSEETQPQSQTGDLHKGSQSQSSSPTSKKVSKTSSSHPRRAGEGRFPEFWDAWPPSERRQDRKACLAKWKAHGLDAIADVILADIATKRETTKWREGYIEAPLVYLNNRRWEDGVQPDGGRPGEAVAAWHETPTGVSEKGVEMGLGAWSEADWHAGRCPDYLTYRARVFKAAGYSPRAA